MKQIYLKSLLLMLMMCVGMGAWAEEPVYTLTFTKLTSGNNYNSYTAAHTITCDNKNWSLFGNQSVGDNLRVGGKNTTETNRTLTSTLALSKSQIGSVVINHEGTGNGKNTEITVNSITVEGSANETFGNSKAITISSPSVSTAGTLTFRLDEGDWDANSYFKITVNYNVKITSGSTANNSYLTITSIQFFGANNSGEGGKTEKSDAGLKFDQTSYVYNINEGANGFKAPSVTAPEGLSITYNSDNTSVADVDALSGAVTIKGEGTANITATSEENDDYKESSASYTLTVFSIEGNGTKENPYTVEDIKKIGATEKKAWVIGTICGTASGTKTLNASDVNSNIALGTAGSFIPVELNIKLDCRSALNIVDNPQLKGVTVKVYGTITTYFSTTGVKNVEDWYIPEIATITLNAACHDKDGIVYGTYSNASAWVVPNDLEVSVIAVENGALLVESFSTGDVVPANTGVMVSATDGGDYTVILSNEKGVDPLDGVYDNALHPSSEPMTGDNLFYRLTMHNGKTIGYWWGAENGAAFTLAANKAYLAVPKNTGVKSNFWFGGETAISAPVVNMENEMIYNLNGQRVSSATKGLYIKNGKKYFVK